MKYPRLQPGGSVVRVEEFTPRTCSAPPLLTHDLPFWMTICRRPCLPRLMRAEHLQHIGPVLGGAQGGYVHGAQLPHAGSACHDLAGPEHAGHQESDPQLQQARLRQPPRELQARVRSKSV